MTPRQAVALQRRLASRIIRTGTVRRPRWIAGADAAYASDGQCVAAAALWDGLKSEVVEQHVVREGVRFPYVPGLLSFREAPAVLRALRRLQIEPDVVLFDGHGYAHPRRFGLASHLGLLIDRPSLGCAKSVLVGECTALEPERGSTAPLVHGDERIGTVLRTRPGLKPVYVSVGHRISLRAAVRITLACCGRFRLPEPTRLADRLVTRERTRVQ